MGEYTRIYNRFTGYTVEDCDCRYCLYYGRQAERLHEKILLLFAGTLAGNGAENQRKAEESGLNMSKEKLMRLAERAQKRNGLER